MFQCERNFGVVEYLQVRLGGNSTAAANNRIANSWAGRWSIRLHIAIGFCSSGRISIWLLNKF